MKIPYTNTIKDHFWVWGHDAGSHNKLFGIQKIGQSRMTPVEAAFYLGVPNSLFIVFENHPEPPFNTYLVSFRPLKRLVWSIVGDSSSIRNDQNSDLDEVLKLSRKFPNLTGAIMDDFFNPPDKQPPLSRVSVEGLKQFRDRLAPQELDLWVVLYQHELDMPVKEYLDQCDVVTFWTWQPERLPNLKENFTRLEALVPNKRKVLGCYLWDYNAGKPMPLELVQYQCQQGLTWLQEGRIEGMIFLASCICDLELETVEWTREWIARVGNQPLRR